MKSDWIEPVLGVDMDAMLFVAASPIDDASLNVSEVRCRPRLVVLVRVGRERDIARVLLASMDSVLFRLMPKKKRENLVIVLVIFR